MTKADELACVVCRPIWQVTRGLGHAHEWVEGMPIKWVVNDEHAWVLPCWQARELCLHAANVPLNLAERDAACSSDTLANLWLMEIMWLLLCEDSRCFHSQMGSILYGGVSWRASQLLGGAAWGCVELLECWTLTVGCGAEAGNDACDIQLRTTLWIHLQAVIMATEFNTFRARAA